MLEFFERPVVKIITSALFGLLLVSITWIYLNSYFTLSLEDDLFGREAIIKHTFLQIKPKKTKQFVFVSTGKDLNLVDDTAGVGNIVVSDRYKLYKLLQAINKGRSKPQFVLIDLEFYYPYNYTVNDSVRSVVKRNHINGFLPDTSIDDSLQSEIRKMDNSAITVLLNDNKSKIIKPLYKANYGIADYKTYGGSINKFRIYYPDLQGISIAGLMHQKIDGAVYSGGKYATFCNHRLCFNTIWPAYYYNPQNTESTKNFEEYHIGDMLLLPDTSIEKIVKGKVIVIGNFEADIHSTSTGQLPGTVILVDIYLSLLNGTQYVSYLWLFFLLVSLSVLSYIAIFGKLPKVSLKLGIFTNMLYSYFSKYFSYLGVLLLLSLISVLIFDVNISLFLPAFIFSSIDFIRQKKYLPKNL